MKLNEEIGQKEFEVFFLDKRREGGGRRRSVTEKSREVDGKLPENLKSIHK